MGLHIHRVEQPIGRVHIDEALAQQTQKEFLKEVEKDLNGIPPNGPNGPSGNTYVPWIIALASVAVGLLGYILSEQKVKSSLSGLGALGLGATVTSLVKRFQVQGEKAAGWLEGKGAWITGLISTGLGAIPLYLTDDKFKGSLLPIGGAVLGGLLGWVFEPIRQAVGLPTEKKK